MLSSAFKFRVFEWDIELALGRDEFGVWLLPLSWKWLFWFLGRFNDTDSELVCCDVLFNPLETVLFLSKCTPLHAGVVSVVTSVWLLLLGAAGASGEEGAGVSGATVSLTRLRWRRGACDVIGTWERKRLFSSTSHSE